MDTNQNIGKNIKKYRKLRGYTQEKLAEHACLETKYISKLEAGKHIPNLKTLDNIVKALNVSYEDIGLGAASVAPCAERSPFYIKALQILNSAGEKEIEYYYGLLYQAQKGAEIFKS